MSVSRVCVFAGTQLGVNPAYRDSARALGRALVARGVEVVYGGAASGLMGTLADAVLDAGGRIIGVIPRDLLPREIPHQGLSDLRIVDSMHQRKALMAALADQFVALPGGFGTCEELFEILTWGQIGIHDKRCGVLNVEGYYDGVLQWLDHAVAQRFLEPEHRSMLIVDTQVERLLDRLADDTPPRIDAWADDAAPLSPRALRR